MQEVVSIEGVAHFGNQKIVTITVVLDILYSAFTADRQDSFRSALARAATFWALFPVNSSDVEILEIGAGLAANTVCSVCGIGAEMPAASRDKFLAHICEQVKANEEGSSAADIDDRTPMMAPTAITATTTATSFAALEAPQMRLSAAMFSFSAESVDR